MTYAIFDLRTDTIVPHEGTEYLHIYSTKEQAENVMDELDDTKDGQDYLGALRYKVKPV